MAGRSSQRSSQSGSKSGPKKQTKSRSGSKKSPARAAAGGRKAASSRSRSTSAEAAKADEAEPDAASDAAARAALRDSDKLYYRIGEVSKLTSVKAHVLRYWETEFRWMAPPKSRSKQRLYRKRDIEFVLLLKRLLWEERYTIAGARQRIQDLGLDEALALLDRPANASAANGESAGPSQAEWISFRAVLDEVQGELTSLQGMLRESG